MKKKQNKANSSKQGDEISRYNPIKKMGLKKVKKSSNSSKQADDGMRFFN